MTKAYLKNCARCRWFEFVMRADNGVIHGLCTQFSQLRTDDSTTCPLFKRHEDSNNGR